MITKNFNRTKIIATIGPASSSITQLKKMMLAGMDVCRLNFSHSEHSEHIKTIQNVRSLNKSLKNDVCLLADLQGPKLRLGLVENDCVIVKKGQFLTLTNKNIIGNSEKLNIRYAHLGKDLKKGEKILIDDGKIEFLVNKIINQNEIEIKVIVGGEVKSRKGFNLPNTKVSMPSLTPKDIEDLDFAIKNNVEWVALSFVREAKDILELKKYIQKKKGHQWVIAKIEKPEAVKNIDSIIEAADGIMIARGDLGVEMPLQDLPLIQKNIIDKCLNACKPVIVATQMMETMIHSSVPTRAEVSDVANAVIDGADALMLSAETSVGKYPVKVIETMQKVICDVESDRRVYIKGLKPNSSEENFISNEICFTAVKMSDHLNAKAIVGMTYSGYSIKKISSFRPKSFIFVFTSNQFILKTLNLVWGIRAFYYNKEESTDQTFSDVIKILKDNKIVKKNDIVVHTASMPINEKSMANSIKISEVK